MKKDYETLNASQLKPGELYYACYHTERDRTGEMAKREDYLILVLSRSNTELKFIIIKDLCMKDYPNSSDGTNRVSTFNLKYKADYNFIWFVNITIAADIANLKKFDPGPSTEW